MDQTKEPRGVVRFVTCHEDDKTTMDVICARDTGGGGDGKERMHGTNMLRWATCECTVRGVGRGWCERRSVHETPSNMFGSEETMHRGSKEGVLLFLVRWKLHEWKGENTTGDASIEIVKMLV